MQHIPGKFQNKYLYNSIAYLRYGHSKCNRVIISKDAENFRCNYMQEHKRLLSSTLSYEPEQPGHLPGEEHRGLNVRKPSSGGL